MTINLFNQDSEGAFLGIILKNPEMIYEVNSIRSYKFSSSVNQVLYSGISEIVENGSIPEKTLVINYLLNSNRLHLAGGEEYINYLYAQNLNRDNFKEYERQIDNNYKARKLIEFASEVSGQIQNVNDIDVIIDSFRKRLEGLEENSSTDQARQLSVDTKNVYETLTSRVDNPGVIGIPLGIKKIDEQIGGLGAGDLLFIGARPSMGKTMTLCNSILNTAKQENPVLIFSMEMSRQLLIERLLSIETGVPLLNIRLGRLNSKEIEQIRITLKDLEKLPIFIDSNFTLTPTQMFSTIRKFKKNHGISLFYLDYIQLLVERNETMVHSLGNVSRSAKLISGELEIGSILLSQLSRSCELRPDKRPLLSDLRQSGNLEEDADIVSFLYRDEYYNKDTKDKGIMEYIIAKNRNGPTGMIPLRVDIENNRIEK